MKVLQSLLLATAVVAQQSVSDKVADLERGKKKKKQQAAMYGYVTTKKPKTTTTEKITTTKQTTTKATTTTPKATTTTGGEETTMPGGPYAPGGSSGYGDPHFHVLGRSLTQPDLCFDYNDVPGSDLVLIQDNLSGFQVIGNLFLSENKENGGIYFKNLRVTSPYNTQLFVDADGWTVDTNLVVNPSFSWQTERMTYADLTLGDFHKQDHGGHKMTVTVIGGVTFEIRTATAHDNVNFKLLDHSLLSDDVEGVIGRFLRDGAYNVKPKSGNTLLYGDEGTLTFAGQSYDVTYQRHAHNKDCWTLKSWDAHKLIQTTK